MRQKRVEVEGAPRLRAKTLGVGERHAHTLFELPTTLGTAVRSGLTRPVRGGSSREPSPCGGTVARDAPANAPEKDEDLHRGAELMLLLRGGGVEAARAGNPEPPKAKHASDVPRRTLPSRKLEPGRHVLVARPPEPPTRAATPPLPRRRFALGERAPARIASAGEGYSPLRLPPPGVKKRKRRSDDADERRRRGGDDHIRAPNTPAERNAESDEDDVNANADEEGPIEDADEDARVRALATPVASSRSPGARRRGPRSESEYRGVTLYKRTGRFESHIWHDGRQRHIGSFRTARDAASAHDRVAIKLRGWGAELNFPASSYGADAGFRRDLAEYDADAFIARVRIGKGATRERLRQGEVPIRGAESNGAIEATANGVGNEAAANGVGNEAAVNGVGNEAPDMRSSSEDEPSHEREPPLTSRGIVSGTSGTTFAQAFRVLQLAAVALLRAQAQAEAGAGPGTGLGVGPGTGTNVGPGTRPGMILAGTRLPRVPARMTAPSRPSASSPPRSPISAGVHLGSPLAMASRAAAVAALALESAIAFAPPRDGLAPAGTSPGTTTGTSARVSFESRRRRFAEWSDSRRRRRSRARAHPFEVGDGEHADGINTTTIGSNPNPVRFSPDAVADAFVSPPAARLPLARAAPATMPRRPETPSTRSYAPVASRADELVATVLARRALRPTATGPTTATETTTASRGARDGDDEFVGSPHLVGRPLVDLRADALPSSARSPTRIPPPASEFKRDRSSSAYRGVTMHRRTRRWESHIWDGDSGKQIYLGSYDERDETTAARAHDLAAIKIGGARRASLNFPPEEYAAAADAMARMSRDEAIAAVRAGRFAHKSERDDTAKRRDEDHRDGSSSTV